MKTREGSDIVALLVAKDLVTLFSIIEILLFEVVAPLSIAELIFVEVSVLLRMELSTYPSATADERHPPCLFRAIRSPPASTRMVADERRKQWPVYCFASGNPRYSAISRGTLPILLIPTHCLVHFAFTYRRKKGKTLASSPAGRRFIYFLHGG